jgi:hypothetical protein
MLKHADADVIIRKACEFIECNKCGMMVNLTELQDQAASSSPRPTLPFRWTGGRPGQDFHLCPGCAGDIREGEVLQSEPGLKWIRKVRLREGP